MVATAIIGSAVVGAGASVAGSMAQSDATQNATDAQSAAQMYAADQQRAMYNQTRADLAPYNAAGQNAVNQLLGFVSGAKPPQMAAVNWNPVNYQPVKMDQATLEQTPGYQFNLSQGLKSTQNSAAARGLGTSGAALKGAASYATGLADSTYQQQFQNATTNAQNTYNANLANSQGAYTAGLNNALNQFNSAVTNQTNQYNRLSGLAGLGESAAAQTGNYGTQTAANIGNQSVATASNIGNNLIQGGNAQAAGYLGAANSLNSGVNNYLMYNSLYSNRYPPAPNSGLYGVIGYG